VPAAALLLAFASAAAPMPAQGFHRREPTRYAATADETVASRANAALAAGALDLPARGPAGRLLAVLQHFGIPPASQTLVTGKTSLQRHRIGPHNPRALYFGPDVYVGWVPGAAALEIAAGDPRLGLVFYTLAQDPAVPPRFVRDDTCLSCHAGARTDDEPGLLLRSVFPDDNGDPIASAGETAVTHAVPIAERWGGWLVTGAFTGSHRGNGAARRDDGGRWHVPPRAAHDLGAFAAEFDASIYPVATSDIGALLALEQQVTAHNHLVRASLHLRWLLAADAAAAAVDGASGDGGAPAPLRPTTAAIADRLARDLVATLLFADEAPLHGLGAAAEPAFAAAFQRLWPADGDGVRLGTFDLQQRTFVLPLSPMVHAPAFAALPTPLRQRVLHRLRVACERGTWPGGVSLTTAQRRGLHRHLQATLVGY
jgi:hypothetical protein